MRIVMAGCLAGIGLIAGIQGAAAMKAAPVSGGPVAVLVQSDPSKPVQPRRAQGLGERQILQNPELQQPLMDDLRFQALMQDAQMQRLMKNPQLQQQMQRTPQLQQMYQLQRRPLPGVLDED